MPQAILADIHATAPEPHVLLFRRSKTFDAQLAQRQLEQQQAAYANGKAAARRK